jgi:hypothetical protein
MHSVEESLLRSRNSVGRKLNRKQMRGSIQLEKACYEVATPSEVKPTMHQEEENKQKRRASSEALCIQSKKVCYEATIQSAAKPTLPQEEKEQAPERGRDRKREIQSEQ